VRRLLSFLLVAWLVIGVIATVQRGYVTSASTNCAGVGTIVVTILAGPLNYLGVNPRVENCDLPEPSQ
jgi:hypothetical protein